jgi:hypothetical protein
MQPQEMFRLTAVAGVTALGLSLGACGGGSSGGDTPGAGAAAPEDSVPPNALTSALSFIEYQKSLAAQTNDTVEPLTLQQQLPPADDTAEPIPIG